MARQKVGDIFEIATRRGFAYYQLINRHPNFGTLIRVLDGLHCQSVRVDLLIDQPTRFVIFFPVAASVKHGSSRFVGSAEVPAEWKAFPIFRDGVVDPATGRVEVWWLWDGDKEWKVGSLAPAEKALPVRAVWNDTLLRERIELGWSSQSDLNAV